MADTGRPCHLELKLLQKGELCAMCNSLAEEHTNWGVSGVVFHTDMPDATRPPIPVGKNAPHIDTRYHDDGAKLRWSLLPWDAVREVVRVLEYGARKYEAHSWLRLAQGRARYTESLIRHTVSYLGGEVVDPESGLPHMSHIACNALFVCAMHLRGIGE